MNLIDQQQDKLNPTTLQSAQLSHQQIMQQENRLRCSISQLQHSHYFMTSLNQPEDDQRWLQKLRQAQQRLAQLKQHANQ